MKIENLSEGQVVFDVGKQKMGNTTISTVVVWEIRVKSIDLEKRTVTASWNSNPPREFREVSWSKWRAEKPLLVKSGFGHRLATREEIKSAKQQEPAR